MKVSFGMYWQRYGRQTMEIPEMDKDEVYDYLNGMIEDIDLPCGEYVQGSDEIDSESIIIIKE